MKKFVAFILVVLLGVASSAAFAAGKESSAKNFIDKLGKDAIEVVGNAKLSEKAKMNALADIIKPSVDFDWIGKFVLARSWKTASEEQRKEFLSLYQSFMIKTYTSRVKEFSSVAFDVTGVNHNGDDEYTVSTKILRPSEAPVLVDYRVIDKGGNIKIIDMVVEGVSLLTTQRSEFASVVSRDGIDGLNEMLKKKIGGTN